MTSGLASGLIAGGFIGLFGAGSTVQAWHAWSRPFWRPVGRVSDGRRRGALAFAIIYDSFALAIIGAIVAGAASGGRHLTGRVSGPGVVAGLVITVLGVLGFFAGVALFWLIAWFNRPAFLVSPWLRWQPGTAAARRPGPIGRRFGANRRRWLTRAGSGVTGRPGVTGDPGGDGAFLAYRSLLPLGGPRGPLELLVDGVARAELLRGQSVLLTLASGPRRIELAAATWRGGALDVQIRPGEIIPLLCRAAGRDASRGAVAVVLHPPGPPTA